MCHFVRLLKNNLEWHIFRSIIYTNKDLNFNIKMTKDFLKTFFGVDETEFGKIVENAAKMVKKLADEYSDENDEKSDTETYYKETKKEYDNGELVKKSEKEYVNGECTKNEEFDLSKPLGSDCGCGCVNKWKCDEPTIEGAFKKNEELAIQIEDMTRYIDKLNDKIRELEKKNAELSVVINNVKKCF